MEKHRPSVVMTDKSVGRTSKVLSIGALVLDESTKFRRRTAVVPARSEASVKAGNCPDVHQRKLATK